MKSRLIEIKFVINRNIQQVQRALELSRQRCFMKIGANHGIDFDQIYGAGCGI